MATGYFDGEFLVKNQFGVTPYVRDEQERSPFRSICSQ